MNENQEAMFGCDPDVMLKEVSASFSTFGMGMTLMSMLSDVQELLQMGMADEARKGLNQVKYIIGKTLPKMHVSPTDISIESEVATLRTMLSKTTKGTWHCLPGRALVIRGEVSPHGYSGHDVLRGHGPSAAEAKANAVLGAKLYNAAEALFDAAELVQHVLNEQDKLPRDQRDPFIIDRAQATLSKLKAALA